MARTASPKVVTRVPELRAAIARKGWTQRTTAQHADIDPTLFSKYLTGLRDMPLEHAVIVADRLGVKVDDIAIRGPVCSVCRQPVAA